MPYTRRALIGAATSLAAVQAAAAPKPASRRGGAPAGAVLREVRAKDGIPAASAAVAAPGRVVWREAVGTDNLELAHPATPDSRFRIGSCSKPVTAVIAVRLVERGLVDLDAPIVAWLPDLPEQHRRTTIRQLLGHQGGIRHYGMLDLDRTRPGGAIDQRTYRTTQDALALFINDKLLFAPGEASSYSSYGFNLIGAVLEKAAGLGFPDLVQREVSAPLGLRIEAEVPAQIMVGKVSPYDPLPKTAPPHVSGPVINSDPVNPGYKWPSGGLIARASDLAQLGAALLEPGYLKAASLEALFTAQVPKKGPTRPPLGLAWRLDRDAQGRRRYHHAGAIQGGRAGMVIFPDAKLAVALTSNLSDAPLDPLAPMTRIAEGFGLA
jgi:CubicO group peptidase (beta-lactamase class C family)